MRRLSAYFVIIFISCYFFISCHSSIKPEAREILDLSGLWRFQLDSTDAGIEQQWYVKTLEDSISLPGSLDEAGKGRINRDTTDLHLNRVFVYEGAAWFQKSIEIPQSWTGKDISLIMERTKVSRVWLDSISLGTNESIFTAQIYPLPGSIRPGKHTLTILIDNSIDLVPVMGSHAYEDHTQTNWLGILGKFYLEAADSFHVTHIKITPDIASKSARINLSLTNPGRAYDKIKLTFDADLWNCDAEHHVQDQLSVPAFSGDTTLSFEIALGENARLWSEFDPALYQLTVTLTQNGKAADRRIVNFGLRDFSVKGTQFAINGKTTFLRGKHDACVFPLTGYPPMDKEGWLRVFRIAQSYGLNHYRFHSWTPPEAAFEAADEAGIYMEPELPIWWFFQANNPRHLQFMMREGFEILDQYTNHPSFVMFSLGNEIYQDRAVLHKMVSDLRAHDDRLLYAQGSNNRGSDPSYAEGDDFWTSFRTAKAREDRSSDVRGSISFLDSEDGGIVNHFYPSTNRTYADAMKESPVPVLGHEIGQYQIYPNYDEMSKYTGILKPWNFLIFKKALEARGMGSQANDFFKASGALSVLCYRADIELAIRTPGFGGFQLLDLQDYPGQGTALVGILDAFMESKGLIDPNTFRQFCDDQVLLLEMEKYCWTNGETFRADAKIANYGPIELEKRTLLWSMISEQNGEVFLSGETSVETVPKGAITSLGKIEIPLSSIQKAGKREIHLQLKDSGLETTYPLWIYPDEPIDEDPEGIHVVKGWDHSVIRSLESGGKVLLFPDLDALSDRTVPGQFISDFWNWEMFRQLSAQYGGRPSPGTLGLLIDPAHPAFREFPTEFHSNWQWWPMAKYGRPYILDAMDTTYRPVVQVVDNINRNHRLGLILEFKIGDGKLLVCMADLPALQEKPEARQLYKSLVAYMQSDAFHPELQIDPGMLYTMFK